jgi:hypothetical protein
VIYPNLKNTGKGRPKGSVNKATADIKALASMHVEAAIVELARIAFQSDDDKTRVAAIKELLDRGFGKATQPIGQDPSLAPIGIVRIPAKASPVCPTT